MQEIAGHPWAWVSLAPVSHPLGILPAASIILPFSSWSSLAYMPSLHAYSLAYVPSWALCVIILPFPASCCSVQCWFWQSIPMVRPHHPSWVSPGFQTLQKDCQQYSKNFTDFFGVWFCSHKILRTSFIGLCSDF